MKAKHLFILLDTFTQDEEVIGSGLGLATKYSGSCYTVSRVWLNPEAQKITQVVSETTNSGKSSDQFPNRVGIYIITHMNIVFQLSGGVGHIASLICDYLDSRSDLGIDCSQLDKLVLMSCVGSDGLKEKFTDPETLKEMNKHAQKQDRYYLEYQKAMQPWDSKRQEYLDGLTKSYEKSPDDFVGSALTGPGATMVQLACALDRRGAHPKIAAWDSGIYGRNDGKKSIRNDPMNPILRHQRLINKVMIQFSRPSSSSGGSIRQLGLQEWSDKPLNLPK
ncbi:MAG: hypothetical protein KC729_03880 [Candidatus Eisenbacteria bacterium]|uniref:Uncharacterized protein n=1 Tax=Eiseniibacteriota bacterium TaxID=2212470 RepID=A0A956LWS2_UNCEI|nr:hypothetical protein [Candidatus Eisenbacteria bacterium]